VPTAEAIAQHAHRFSGRHENHLVAPGRAPLTGRLSGIVAVSCRRSMLGGATRRRLARQSANGTVHVLPIAGLSADAADQPRVRSG
jgi:hypothetical protein